jgi:hypothetical protein
LIPKSRRQRWANPIIDRRTLSFSPYFTEMLNAYSMDLMAMLFHIIPQCIARGTHCGITQSKKILLCVIPQCVSNDHSFWLGNNDLTLKAMENNRSKKMGRRGGGGLLCVSELFFCNFQLFFCNFVFAEVLVK